MIRPKHILAVLALVHLAAAGVFANIRFDLRAAALLKPGPVTLGDVAHIKAEDPRQAAQLAGMKIGMAPLPGNTRAITRETIAMYLQRAKIDMSAVAWDGPSYCLIQVNTLTLSGELIGQTAIDYLADLATFQREGVQMVLAQTPQDQVLPTDGAAPELTATANAHATPWGRVTVFVSIRRGNEIVATIPVSVHVTCDLPVCYLTRNVRKGDTLSADDIEVRRMKLGPGSADLPYVFEVEHAAGKKARVNLAAGRPLTTAMILTPMAVKKGNDVAIFFQSGHLQVVTKGVSLADGQVGDQVDVRIMPQGKETKCRVTAPDQVEVILSGVN
jgi:flagella basal body P-ring formation protein FlgA